MTQINRFHVIKDPVHGTMQFTTIEDRWVKPFLDHPNFQRLRHIKQLGMGDYIFPGAMHSRFNHCIGCCYVSSQIANKINLAEEERQLVMIACLLHDIGHGPFSHAFEGVFTYKPIRHENWTPYFLADFANSDFFDHYNQLNPTFPIDAAKFELIAAMIMHKPEAQSVAADIVSSQLDADRLDYLLRDSHFSGVQYGQFDFRWMLHCLAIVETQHGLRLGINYKGIGVVEHYLMARRLMMRNIYQNLKKLAIEDMLVQLLAVVAENMLTQKSYQALASTRLGEFLIAVNDFNHKIAQATDKNALTQQFLADNYANYKELCDYDVYALIRQLANSEQSTSATEIAKRLYGRIMPTILRLDPNYIANAKLALQEFKATHSAQYQSWQLRIIETPHRAYSGEEDPIWVINEQGIVQSIAHFSIMLSALSDKLEHLTFIYVDRAIANDKIIINFLDHLKKLI
jgi:uncharacterized protein